MRGSTSALMPTPVSLTRTTAFGSSRSTVTVTLASRRRVLRGVAQQVLEHLPEPHRVARDRHRCARDADLEAMSAGVIDGAAHLRGDAHDARDVEALAFERDLPLRHPRHVEQIVDDSRHAPRLAGDDLQRTLRLGSRHLTLERGNGVDDRRQRIAQLVSEHPEELVLLPVRRQQRFFLLAPLGHVDARARHRSGPAVRTRARSCPCRTTSGPCRPARRRGTPPGNRLPVRRTAGRRRRPARDRPGAPSGRTRRAIARKRRMRDRAG